MTHRPGSRLVLASAISLGAALIAVLAPWDARATSPAGGQAAHSRSASVLAIHPPATARPGAAPTATPTAMPATTPTLAGSPLVNFSEVQIPITYHSQQDGDWCDPTDIEMWLQADGVPLHGLDDYAIQQGFWNYELANNDGYTLSQWNASPYAVALTLDHFGGWDDIGDDPQPTAEAAGVVISYSLDMLEQPVIVMVGGGVHYVLVTGVDLSAAGADAPPLSVTIDDPLAYGVSGTPPAGSDGTETMSWDDFTDWYTANTAHGGVWAGEWVLIAAGIPLIG
ncbi:MAG: hypothetical protein ABSB36_04255 [Candidatus Dormibacteria bacterium]|jgi:hypothetical protein